MTLGASMFGVSCAGRRSDFYSRRIDMRIAGGFVVALFIVAVTVDGLFAASQGVTLRNFIGSLFGDREISSISDPNQPSDDPILIGSQLLTDAVSDSLPQGSVLPSTGNGCPQGWNVKIDIDNEQLFVPFGLLVAGDGSERSTYTKLTACEKQ